MKDFIVSDEEMRSDKSKLGMILPSEVSTADQSGNSAQIQYYDSAYSSCPLYPVNEDKSLVAIPYPLIYRYRGKHLKLLNCLEYCSCVRVVKDHTPNKTTHRGRSSSKQFRFGGTTREI